MSFWPLNGNVKHKNSFSKKWKWCSSTKMSILNCLLFFWWCNYYNCGGIFKLYKGGNTKLKHEESYIHHTNVAECVQGGRNLFWRNKYLKLPRSFFPLLDVYKNSVTFKTGPIEKWWQFWTISLFGGREKAEILSNEFLDFFLFSLF